MSQPFYHLRPNKNIDRCLFVNALSALRSFVEIEDYHYTGFGSYLFDDFKLLHETLGISKMISLEGEYATYKRACFNCPYKCIDIKNIMSTDYISGLDLDENEHNIFWLDFVAPSQLGQQLSDYAALLNILNVNDIVRITLNANPATLPKTDNVEEIQAYRLETLRERVPPNLMPLEAKPTDITTKEYPLLLLKILKNASFEVLRDEAPYSSRFLFPLFSTVYADGQQMLTVTGIVLDSHEQEEGVKEALKMLQYCTFSWDKPSYINVPELSLGELLAINKLIPSRDSCEQLSEQFPFLFPSDQEENKSAENYVKYYKYYPSFHKINV